MNCDYEKLKILAKNIFGLNGAVFDDRELRKDYSLNLDSDLKRMIKIVQILMNCIEESMDRRDWTATLAFLIYLRIYVMNLYWFFDNISEDLKFLIQSDAFLSDNSLAGDSSYSYRFEHDMSDTSDVSKQFLSEYTESNVNFNMFKELLRKLAAFNDQDFSLVSWDLDYELDFHHLIGTEINKIGQALDAACQELDKNNIAELALILKQIIFDSKELSIFFEKMLNDVDKIVCSDVHNFPEFPDDYVIPESYGLPRELR